MTTEVMNKPNGRTTLTLRQQLDNPKLLEDIGKAMPAHCKPERMLRVAITMLSKTPKLAECTPSSFFNCLLSLSQWGLEPDGRRAHLIPYDNKKQGITECQLIIDYKGLVELAYRSGVVRSIHADVVREGDVFDYSAGQIRRHTPHFLRRDAEKPAAAGDVYAAYSTVELAHGAIKTEVMSREEVDGIRDRSSGYRAFKSGFVKTTPWQSDWSEMAKKTAFRRVSKWLPLSADIADAFDRDDDKLDSIIVESRPRKEVESLDGLTAMLTGPGDSQVNPVVEQAEGVDVPTEAPSDLSDADEFRADIRDKFTRPGGKNAKRSLYDTYCGPDAKEFPEWQVDIVREEWEQAQQVGQ